MVTPTWVCKAIAFNPHCPRYLAAGLINFINTQDLRLFLELGERVDKILINRVNGLINEPKGPEIQH
jgi:hypothetical protein